MKPQLDRTEELTVVGSSFFVLFYCKILSFQGDENRKKATFSEKIKSILHYIVQSREL